MDYLKALIIFSIVKQTKLICNKTVDFFFITHEFHLKQRKTFWGRSSFILVF
jgi:hypothetical protein